MLLADVVKALEGRAGQPTKAVRETSKKVAGSTYTKRTTGWYRFGIKFANLKAVQEGIANGERGEVQPLKWGEWNDEVGVPNLIVSHKGKDYLRFYLPIGGDAQPTTSGYFRDGEPITKAEWAAATKPSTGGPVPLTFTVEVGNLVSLG
jgi:hypothetical protein